MKCFSEVAYPRTKQTKFVLTATSGKAIPMEYSSYTTANTGLINMEVKGNAPFKGVLWSNDGVGPYHVDRALLHQLKEAVDSQMEDKYFIRFLLTIGEVESGGCVGKLEEELEYMEKDGAFNTEVTTEEQEGDDIVLVPVPMPVLD